MDFAPTEASTDLTGLTRRIAGDRATPERLTEVNATADRTDRELWAELAKAGVLGAALPESVGGGGFGVLEQCAVLVELGRAGGAFPGRAVRRPGAGWCR